MGAHTLITMTTEVLRTIIDNQPLCNVYEEYLAKTCAWENFAFYYEVEFYRQLERKEVRQIQAHEIYEQFLANDAPFELGDINRQIRQNLSHKLDDADPDLFSPLQRATFRQLARSSVSDFLDDQLFYSYRDTVFSYSSSTSMAANSLLLRLPLPSCLS